MISYFGPIPNDNTKHLEINILVVIKGYHFKINFLDLR